jgi:hypothetical protein
VHASAEDVPHTSEKQRTAVMMAILYLCFILLFIEFSHVQSVDVGDFRIAF